MNISHKKERAEDVVKEAQEDLACFIKRKRKASGLTQPQLAERAGVGLRFIRELEAGKKLTLRMDKANQVLALFGHTTLVETFEQF